MATKIIIKHVDLEEDELSDLWDYEAPQQDVYSGALIEAAITMEVDLDTGKVRFIALDDVKLSEPTVWYGY